MNSRSLGLYSHVPFCVHKCGYCDFNSWAETRRDPQVLWLAAFKNQSAYWAERLRKIPHSVDTLFFGGGTPSLLENDLLVEAGQALQRDWRFSPDIEWTFECNPETLDIRKLEALRAAGANRLSIGIQSFRDTHLDRLERRARRQDNLKALELVAKNWEGRWSFDLMFGLPNQSRAEWREDLDLALSFGPGHLSAYQLTLTTARSQNWQQPDEDVLLAMFDETEERSERAGLKKYETSNFAKPGEESRHNLRYWRLEPFLGLGPGASGLLSGHFLGLENRWGSHQRNPDRFENWQKGAGTEAIENTWTTPREPRSHVLEMLMMGFRLNEGILASRLGPLDQALSELAKNPQLIELIERTSTHWRVTTRGARQLDSFLPWLAARFEKVPLSTLDSRLLDPTF